MTEKQQYKRITELDWREAARSEMFELVILAVDGARGEAEASGRPDWVRYYEGQIFPFLEAEKEKARTEETERDAALHDLLNVSGVSEEEARLMMRDDDLWLIGPEFRYGSELDGEAGVKEWETVAEFAYAFSELATNYIDRRSHAATQLAFDAAVRAREALRRARARVEAGEAELE